MGLRRRGRRGSRLREVQGSGCSLGILVKEVNDRGPFAFRLGNKSLGYLQKIPFSLVSVMRPLLEVCCFLFRRRKNLRCWSHGRLTPPTYKPDCCLGTLTCCCEFGTSLRGCHLRSFAQVEGFSTFIQTSIWLRTKRAFSSCRCTFFRKTPGTNLQNPRQTRTVVDFVVQGILGAFALKHAKSYALSATKAAGEPADGAEATDSAVVRSKTFQARPLSARCFHSIAGALVLDHCCRDPWCALPPLFDLDELAKHVFGKVRLASKLLHTSHAEINDVERLLGRCP